MPLNSWFVMQQLMSSSAMVTHVYLRISSAEDTYGGQDVM